MSEPARPFRVYVAGSGMELDRVRAWLRALREIGAEITKDWTAEVEAAIASGRGDAGLDEETRTRAAHEDFEAITRADLVWFLAPVTMSRGAYTELGYALGRRKFVCASGLAVKRSIFTSLAHRSFETDADAFEAIVELARDRGSFRG